MTQFIALHNELHQQLRINTAQIEATGATHNMLPVVLSEFLKLVVHYPIVFTKNSETGQFTCVALLGFSSGENLFWQDNQWRSIYTPLQIMRQPFFLGEEQGQSVICIDSQSPLITQDTGEALFDAQGGETAYLTQVKSTLAALLDGEQQTQEFIQTLLSLQLITPMTLDIRFANNQPQRIQGLYTIDEEKLAQLTGAQLAQLQQAGQLQAIYTMLASLGQIYALIQKKNERLGLV